MTRKIEINDQAVLRSQLKAVRHELGQARLNVARLESEERKLKELVIPKQERCQRCLGLGSYTGNDLWAGPGYSLTCEACGGTGVWKEAV